MDMPDYLSDLKPIFDVLMDSLQEWMHIIDREYHILYINSHFLEINRQLNLAFDVVGKNVFEIYPFIKDQSKPEYQQVFATGQPLTSQSWVIFENRKIFTRTTKLPVKIGQEIRYIITIIKNLSDSLESEDSEYQASKFAQKLLYLSTELLNPYIKDEIPIINRGLQEILDFFTADRAYVFSVDMASNSLSNTYEVCRMNILPMMHRLQNANMNHFKWFSIHLINDGIVKIDDVHSLPDDAFFEKGEFLDQKIKSLICIPFYHKGIIHGFIGLDIVNQIHSWTAEEITDLQLIAKVFENFFKHRIAEREQQQLETQLVQIQKMESIGRLAGGIAHDFNNLLTSMMGNLSLLLMDVKPSDPIFMNLKELNEAVESAAGITRQLLTFSRKQVIDPKIVHLNQIINNMQRLIMRFLSVNVQVSLDLAQCRDTVKIDVNQFEQILINLLINARDAIHQSGNVFLKSSQTEFTEQNPHPKDPRIKGSFYILEVRDTGIGMTDDVKNHLFEPFFTTKPKEKGTGLGLATVFGAIRQNNGFITADSTLGHGSTFTIYLPIVEGKIESIIEIPPLPVTHQNATLVYVEDDLIVLNSTQRLLKRLGYSIEGFPNGFDALQFLEHDPTSIDLIITDVIMPKMNGKEFAEKVLQLRPTQKILFTSGYSDVIVDEHGVLATNINFLNKPYSYFQLERKIQAILGASDEKTKN